MKKLDILFVKPGSQKEIYGQLSAYELTAIEPPLWASLLAAYLRKKGFSVALLDAELENLTYAQTARYIKDADPLLAAIVVSGTNPSASTMNMTGAGKILSLLKDLAPEIQTVLAGLHPSALPERTMAEEPVDFVCQGEGFSSFEQLICALNEHAQDFPIQGIWYKKDGQIIGNKRPAMIKDLDVIPMAAWDLVPLEKYRAHNWHCFDKIEARQPYAVLYTSLGCPFNCSFCCINALFGRRTLRYRSMDAVMAELEYLVEQRGVRNIKIMDEMFAFDEKRVTELCDRIIERKYDLNFWAYARVNTVTQKMLEKMREAGVMWAAYGFESGSKRVIEDVTKGYHLEAVQKVVDMTYQTGMHIVANFIFGLPEDDYDTMNETLASMLAINAEWANIYCAMAYPGSRLYDTALSNNWALPKSWQGYSQYSADSLPLPTRYLTGGQVLSFRDYAFDVYYKSPRYLSMLQKKFGTAAMEHVRKMSEKKLARQNAAI